MLATKMLHPTFFQFSTTPVWDAEKLVIDLLGK